MKSKLGIILLGILVFLLGGIAGSVSYHLYWKHIRSTFTGMPPKPDDIIDNIAKSLKMDDLQKESFRTIFNQTRHNFQTLDEEFGPKYEALNKQYGPLYEALHQQYRPQWETIRNESDEKIKKILNQEQRKKFEDFLAKFKSAPQMKIKPSNGK
jgi:hypothetical protein